MSVTQQQRLRSSPRWAELTIRPRHTGRSVFGYVSAAIGTQQLPRGRVSGEETGAQRDYVIYPRSCNSKGRGEARTQVHQLPARTRKTGHERDLDEEGKTRTGRGCGQEERPPAHSPACLPDFENSCPSRSG